MHKIDLRSDTCSYPDEEMRQAIAKAAVGNDSWGEDPSVNELQELACKVTGKEAAMLCPSGTMANLVAGMTYAQNSVFGSEVILNAYSHSYWYEVGGLSNLARLTFRTVDSTEEYLPLGLLEQAIRPINGHMPRSRILWLENTFMLGGGRAIPLAQMQALQQFARKHELVTHLDGARIFNAAAVLQTDVATIAQYADSLQFCLSKCLGAPFGSVLCGSKVFIEQAKRYRQVLGGGMRQAGIMAAAGTLGLRRGVSAIALDNKRAARLAGELNRLWPGSVPYDELSTNLVLFDPSVIGKTPIELRDEFISRGIYLFIVPTAAGERIRMMTYPNISEADIDTVLAAFRAYA